MQCPENRREVRDHCRAHTFNQTVNVCHEFRPQELLGVKSLDSTQSRSHLGKQACLFCAKLLLRLRQAWSQFDNIIYYSINKMTLLQSTNRAFCPSISRKPVRTARMAASAHATAKLNFTLQDAGSTPPSQKEHTILYTHCLCPYAERAWLVLLEKVSDDHRYWLHSNY